MLTINANKKLKEIWGLDLRSLAFFRIALALLIITNLWERSQSLTAHYTDFGVLPRGILDQNLLSPWAWSLHFFGGEPFFQSLLFLLAILAAIVLLVGYHTQWATLISWIVELSVINRNWLVNTGGDKELCLLLFWSIFLPLGAYYSVDRALNSSEKPIPKSILSGATIAYTLQICLIYWLAWALKSGTSWRQEGTAVYYALSLDYMATPFGHFLLNFPSLLVFFTFATLAIVKTKNYHWLLIDKDYNQCLQVKIFRFFQKSHHFLAQISLISSLHFRPLIIRSSLLANLFTLYLLGCVLLWNFNTLNPVLFGLPNYIIIVNRSLGLDQYWGTFAPSPSLDDGWYVIPGKLKDGTEIDLFRDGKPISWEKPKLVSELYPTMYWLKYMEQLASKKNPRYRPYYAKYLCRSWNSQHQGLKQLDNLEINYMLEKTLPNYQTPKIDKLFLLKQKC